MNKISISKVNKNLKYQNQTVILNKTKIILMNRSKNNNMKLCNKLTHKKIYNSNLNSIIVKLIKMNQINK